MSGPEHERLGSVRRGGARSNGDGGLHGVGRRRVVGGLAAAVGAALAACSVAQPSGGRTDTTAKQPVTLRLNYRNEQHYPVRAQQFTAQYPWIKVDLIADSGYEKLVTQLAAGDLGDVIWLSTGVGTFFEFASLGHLMPLDPLVAADKYDLKQHFPVTIETARIVDNKLFGLPSLLHPSAIGLFYSVNLFETAGVKPPTLTTTYDELVDLARRMTGGTTPEGRPARWGLLTGTAYYAVLCFLRSFGGEMLDPPFLGKKPAIDRAPARQALQYLYDLRHKHRVHPIQGVDKVAFTDGNLAMHVDIMSGGFRLEGQVAGRFRMDAALIPKGASGKRGSQGHVDMLGMYSQTKHRDEAWLLHKWYVNKDTSMALYAESGLPGARLDGWNDPQVVARPMFKVFKDFVEKEGVGLIALPWNYRMLDISNLTPKLFEPMWTGTQSPDQTIAAALGPMQQQLDQSRPAGAK